MNETRGLWRGKRIDNGEWVHLGDDEWGCSYCGYVISTDSSREHPMSETRCNDFCSKCGAKMKTPDAET